MDVPVGMAGLPEFLLTRFAEEEGAAQHVADAWCRERILADCAAKRRIVQHQLLAQHLGTPTTFADGWNYGLTIAVRRIGQAYATHSDYQVVWGAGFFDEQLVGV